MEKQKKVLVKDHINRKDFKMNKKKSGGLLKDVPKDNVGLGKLPTSVRNEMGYKKKGGKVGKPLGCGKAERGFGKGPYKKRGM